MPERRGARAPEIVAQVNTCARFGAYGRILCTAMAELTCTRCLRAISADDVVELDGAGVAHVNCRRPRDLTHDERSLLYGYCWAHPIVCSACGWSFRLFELDADPLDHYKRTRCPHCEAELLELVREHLFACSLSPEALRRRAQETRETARRW
jgi:DNA-directed RNA polymerase subunit RPC12/RpoP